MRVAICKLITAIFLYPILAASTVIAVPLQWKSSALAEHLSVEIFEPSKLSEKPSGPVATVIYLKNLSAPRVGTESDEAIIKDFRADGFLVVTLDYKNDPRSRIPHINIDLGKLRGEIRDRTFLDQYKIDNAHVYIVPSGHRLFQNLAFYQDGDRQLAIDLIYPSKPSHPTGVVLEFSCDNKDRMGNGSLSACSDTLLDAEATEGFAVAMADHPVAAPYKGIDPMPDCVWKNKAAVRTLRAKTKELNLGENIVTVGFSRGSGMALMLVTTSAMQEFEQHGENLEVDSSIQGAVVLSGRFTYLDLLPSDHMLPRYQTAWGSRDQNMDIWRRAGALDYLQAAPVELFLSINSSESPDALHQMEVLQKRLTALGSTPIFMMEHEPRGHKVPLDPVILAAMNKYISSRLRADNALQDTRTADNGVLSAGLKH